MSYLFTKEGFEKLKSDLESAKKRRPEMVKELSRARDLGDLSENGAYKGAKFVLSDLDRKIRHLERLTNYAKVMEKPKSNETVQFGHTITLRRVG